MDISMCFNEHCKKKATCYRFITKSSDYQAYSTFDSNNCEYYDKANPIFKFNNGMGATLCHHCFVIIKEGNKKINDLLCKECKKILKI